MTHRGHLLAAFAAATAVAVSGCASDTGSATASGAADGAAVTVNEQESSGLHGTVVPAAAPEQRLRDTTGRPRSIAGLAREDVVALFFGFTHCPDICPTAMADLTLARRALPQSLRDRVTIAFVTEDPRRDKPQVLRDWLDAFDPSVVGLIGGNDASAAMLDELNLPATTFSTGDGPPSRHAPTHGGHGGHGGYDVNHAGAVYLFAPGGRSVIYTESVPGGQFAEDFTALLGAGPGAA